MKNNKYNATFILDTRSYQEPIETLVEKLKGVITSVGGKVESVENLGQKNFVRVTDKKFPSGIYVNIGYEGPASSVLQISEKLKLDKTINRILVKSA